MSLNGALNIGGTALAINQAAIQTVGNNIANVGNDDYTRQTVNLGTTPDTQLAPGQFVGNGVQLDGIARQVDEALNARGRALRDWPGPAVADALADLFESFELRRA